MNSEIVAGLVGALVGAFIGLAGVVWQFRAKSMRDKRQLGAELLFHAQQLHDGYLEEFGPEEDRVIRHTLPELKQHQDQLVLLMRTWELVWDQGSFAAAKKHVASAITYYQCAASQSTIGSKPGYGELPKYEAEWFATRERLIEILSADFGIRWWQIKRRFKAWRKDGEADRIAVRKFDKLMKRPS
ncbi:hypothetical protein ACSYDW_01435 [Paeniglutamicibacter sp. R2-26]|uniref:hypothetical protein n=1 Tax=Paeniglutamicibacter sp. R2-26 TaxID=3144417 RepID=UPI003EE80F1B